MAYTVTWRVVGPDERTVDRDTFAEAFSRREDAVAFVLDKLSAFPNLGYDRDRGFWGRSAGGPAPETRFVIARARALSHVMPRR